MEKIYSVCKFFTDYEYPECSSYAILGSFRKREDAQEDLRVEVVDNYEHGANFDSDEEFEYFLNRNFRSTDCFIEEREDYYIEFNVIESKLK